MIFHWIKVKVWFFFLFFLLLFQLGGCGKSEHLADQRNQELLSAMNETIAMINSGLSLSNALFSGTWSLLTTRQDLKTQLDLTWEISFLHQDLFAQMEGVFVQNRSPQKHVFLDIASKIRKSDAVLFFFPERLEISLGEGNIQGKFLQLFLKGLVRQRSMLELKKNPHYFQGLPEFPSLFSGTRFQGEVFANFLSECSPSLVYLTGEAGLSSKGDREFQALHLRYNEHEFLFSWSFDGESLTGVLADREGIFFQWTLTMRENQLFAFWKWENKSFTAQLSSLPHNFYHIESTLRNPEKPEERSELRGKYFRNPQKMPLQSPPNSYIFLEKYLGDLNIGF